jgi:hypothetical protein
VNVSALFAVVDGLPPGHNGTSEGEVQSTEGLAIMFGNQEDCLPDLWQNVDGEHRNIQCQLQPSNLLFKMHQDSVVNGVVIPQRLRIPLANTMFQNGRISTLLVSSWNRAAVSAPFKKTQQIEKKTQEICPFVLVPSPRMKIPLTYLTPPRRIVSGLGNIVRQVMGKDDKPVSASQELEASIDAYLETRELHKQTLAVWALLIPNNEPLEEFDDRPAGLSFEKDEISPDLGLNHSTLDDYIGYWLRKGASLHRVCTYIF